MKHRYNVNQRITFEEKTRTIWQFIGHKYPDALYVWRYLLFQFGWHEMIVAGSDSTCLAVATKNNRHKLITAVASQSSRAQGRSESLSDYYNEWDRIQSECNVFISEMRKEKNKTDIEICMRVLLQTLLQLIKKKKNIPKINI